MAQRLAVILGVLGFLTGRLDAAPTPAQRCAAAKVKAAGKTAAAKLKCHQKAIAKNRAVDLGCPARAELRFAAALVKAEVNGGCATTGDAQRIEAMVDEFVSELVDSLSVIPATTTSTTTTTTLRVPTSVTTISSTSTSVSVPTSAPGGSSMSVTTASTTSATLGSSTSTITSTSTTVTSSTTTTTAAVVTPCGGISPNCSGTCPAGLVCVGMTGEFCVCR